MTRASTDQRASATAGTDAAGQLRDIGFWPLDVWGRVKMAIEDNLQNNAGNESWVAKVPEVTLVFWIIKILCTTIGETGGDAFHDVVPR